MSITLLKNDIKNNTLRKLYLLWGEEKFLIRRYINELEKSICNKEVSNMNVTFFEGEVDIDELLQACNTPPIFAEKRLVLVKNSGFFKYKSAGQGKVLLCGYLSNLPEEVCLVFEEDNVNEQSPNFEAIKQHGLIVECNHQEPRYLAKWVKIEFQSYKKEISAYLATYLVEQCGQEMNHINNEICKIVNYVGDRTQVEKQDIDAVCIKPINTRIFDLADSMLQKGRNNSLSILNDLIELKETPTHIILMIARHFRNLLKSKLLLEEGYAHKQVALKLKVSPYVVGKFARQSSNLTVQQLKNVLIDCFKADYDIKTGRMDGRIAVELIISKNSGHS